MSTIKPISSKSLAAICGTLPLLFCSAPTLAAGVKAGVIIENTATATYNNGTTTGTIQSNKVSVRVDELLDVSVAGLTSSLAANGGGQAVLAYSLVNTGNGPEAFNLAATPAVAGNDFDVAVSSIVIDTNDNGTYDPGVDQMLGAGAATPEIAADTSLKVFVIVQVPSSVADGTTSQITLTATAATGSGTPGTAFAGAGAGGGDAVVGQSGAHGAANDSIRVEAATVSLSKSATLLNQFGSSKPVPGAVITYQIDAAVSGSGSVSNLVVNDVIPDGTTYEAGSLKLDGSTLTDAADSDAGAASSAGVAVQLGTTSGGTTRSVTFKVKIN